MIEQIAPGQADDEPVREYRGTSALAGVRLVFLRPTTASCSMNRATRVPASTVVRMKSASNMMAK